MRNVLIRMATVTKTPSDGQGTFDFEIAAFDTVDTDGEKIANYKNVEEGRPATIDVDYGHLAVLGGGADPLAGKIGTAQVDRFGKKLLGAVQLDLDNKVAVMVYERLQLPSDDPAYLGEVSVWFAYDPDKVEVAGGIRTIVDAELLSVSVVKAGAQATAITNIKARLEAEELQYVGPSDLYFDMLDMGLDPTSLGDMEAERKSDDEETPVLDNREDQTKAPTPTTESALRAHLAADPPEGHGTPASEDDYANLEALQTYHDAGHSDGAEHEHDDAPIDEEGADAEKAGRVIGAKSLANLKERLGAALDEWAAEVNKTGDETTDEGANAEKSRNLEGSLEYKRDLIRVAVMEWYEANFPTVDGTNSPWVDFTGTFDDHVVVCISTWNAPPEYFQFDYTIDAEDNVQLGEAVAVQLTTVIETDSSVEEMNRLLDEL